MTINCRHKLLDLSSPIVMGILNVTPDSFYDGGVLDNIDAIVDQSTQMLIDGASILDIGGYSSRPGADDVSVQEEMDRVLPAIEVILKENPEAILSIDTFRSEVARAAILAGASIVNDITAGADDPGMLTAVAQLQVPYIMMHMRGTPATMQQHTEYTDVVRDVNFYFSKRIASVRNAGINDVIIDPGFGFAKTVEQNYTLLDKLSQLNTHNVAMLAGVSRKSMIYKTLDCTADDALNGTTALHMCALERGANILRVHDVKEAMECITLYKKLKP